MTSLPTDAAPPPRSLELVLVALSLLLWPLAALHPVVNSDIWWHLDAARWILEHGRVPVEEFASWTAVGSPWYDYEWLWQLAVLGLWNLGGGAALVLTTALLALAAGYFLYRAVRASGAEPALAAVLLWPALFTARIRFQARPQMVTLVLLALALWLLQRHRALRDPERAARPGRLWILVPLTALWANLHPGFLFALALIGLAFLGELLDLGRERWRREAREEAAEESAPRLGPARLRCYLKLGLACGLASLVSPRPLGPHLLALESLFGFRAIGFRNVEWEPLPFDMAFLPFWILLLGTALLLVAAPRRDATDLLWLGVFGLLAVQTQRSAALLALVAPPLAAASLRRLSPRPITALRGLTGPAARRASWGVCLAFILATLLLLPGALRSPLGAPRFDVAWERVPVEAASFVQREELLGRMFNHYRLGGYLGYRLPPERPVFADGKHIPYLPVLGEMQRAMESGYEAFQGFLGERGVEYAVLHYDQPPEPVVYGTDPETGEPRTGLRAWSTLWFHSSQWALVFWDDSALVKVRRGGPNMHLIGPLEYRHIDPEDWRHQLREVRAGRLDPAPLLRDLERKLDQDPSSRRARRLHQVFSEAKGGDGSPR